MAAILDATVAQDDIGAARMSFSSEDGVEASQFPVRY